MQAFETICLFCVCYIVINAAQSFVMVIDGLCQFIVGWFSVKLSEMTPNEEDEEEKSNVIGFQIPTEEITTDEDEDD